MIEFTESQAHEVLVVTEKWHLAIFGSNAVVVWRARLDPDGSVIQEGDLAEGLRALEQMFERGNDAKENHAGAGAV